MKAALLGSGGWIPTATRETCCLCVREGDDVLFLDAGTGIHRALERKDLLAGARSVHVLLSHFHLDHVVGLGYLPGLDLAEPPVVWGPGQSLYDTTTRSILGRLLEPPFFAGLDAVTTRVGELVEGDNTCGSFVVRARRQSRHTEPTLAFRLGDEVAYCTDTAADGDNAAFADGCSVLFHEAWSPNGGVNDDIHSSARDAGAIARQANVDRLVLVHVNPFGDDQSLEPAAQSEFAQTTVGRDDLEIDLG